VFPREPANRHRACAARKKAGACRGYSQGRDADDFKAATAVVGFLNDAVNEIKKLDCEKAVRGMSARERAVTIKSCETLRAWLAVLKIVSIQVKSGGENGRS
jgi:hypothetical protein